MNIQASSNQNILKKQFLDIGYSLLTTPPK